MAKRGATSELNHNNWDDEEEPEEAGVFIQADKETLQNRVIKKAKRRGIAEDSGSKGAFSGFGGLTGGVTKANTFSGFGAPGKSTFGTLQGFKTNPASGEATKLTFGTSSTPVQPSNGSKEQSTTGVGKSGGGKGSGDWKDSPAYFSFLKALNLSVLAWIKQHVEENPYIILTPIFKDYEQYLLKQEKEAGSALTGGFSSTSAKKDVEPSKNSDNVTLPTQSDSKKESPEADVQKPTSAFSGSGSANTLKGFSFGSTSAAPFKFGDSSKTSPSKTTSLNEKSGVSSVVDSSPTAASVTSSGFSFGLSSSIAASKPLFSFGTSSSTPATSSGLSFGTSSTPASSSGFSFGTSSTPATSSGFSFGTSSTMATSGFSFGTSSTSATTTGFSFGASSSQATTSGAGSSNGANDDDDYVPPKPEVREIKENDALYTKRCKLYFQRNDQWVDKGVGNLHLKPVSDNKTQILVRADTNLGNILLNVMLSQSLPVSRQGKNNVLIVCVPNPPLDSKASEDDQNKPVPMLVRVKTGEDADELFEKINERKKLL